MTEPIKILPLAGIARPTALLRKRLGRQPGLLEELQARESLAALLSDGIETCGRGGTLDARDLADFVFDRMKANQR